MFFLATTAIPVTSPAHRLPSGCKIQPPLLPLVYKAPWDSSSPSLPISSCVTVSTMISSPFSKDPKPFLPSRPLYLLFPLPECS